MMRSILALILLLISAPVYASACPDWTHKETFVRDQLGEATWVQLPPQRTATLTALVNGMNPPTDWTGERAWFVYTGRDAAAVIDIGGGCAWTTGWRSHGDIDRLLRAAADSGA